MSAEFLREAAALMRERAEKSYPSPWRSTESCVWSDKNDDEFPMAEVSGGVYRNIENTAAHIASWHPDAVLAVADWLDATAAEHEADSSNPRVNSFFADFDTAADFAALAVANAYLGRQP